MAQSKAITTGADPIINGLATVNSGNTIQNYDGGVGRTEHFASGDSLTLFQVQDVRYRFHGGSGGSGNWEG